MIFGKIEYLNLLPFHVYIKRYIPNSRFHGTIHFKKGVPSHINEQFKRRQIDAAFISSIESKKYKGLDLGIIAKKEVKSVLLFPGAMQKDSASATSNHLAELLGLEGEIVIGDRALRVAKEREGGIDLAKAWQDKYHLPFVFARLCYHKKGKFLEKRLRHFSRYEPKRIPYYLLQKASRRSGLSPKEINDYLTHISYKMDGKAKHSLYRFLHA